MSQNINEQARTFIDNIVNDVEPVLKALNEAAWNATTTGKEEYYKEYEEREIEFRKYLSNKDLFEKAKEFHLIDISDPLLKREVEITYLEFLGNQIPEDLMKEMVSKSSALEKKFNTFRASVDGKVMTENEIREIMQKNSDPEYRKKIWEASKQIGKEVASGLVDLVKTRNKAAKILGFDNYYEMQLNLQEFTEEELYKILDNLAELTDEPFKNLKNEIDTSLADKFSIDKADLRPWHYEDVFFQTAPNIYNVELDKYFEGKDIVKITQDYYETIGMPVEDIIARSDLYEKEGKEQHAYCTFIDRKKDIRILANVINNEYWTNTMLHELGHAIYDKYIDENLPFTLREAAHIFITEAVAEMFGRLVHDPKWLATVDKGADNPELSEKLTSSLRASMLIIARWVLVMSNFERAMYKNPDQDLNKLWWDLVEKYQMVTRPDGRDEPDFAAKIHLTGAPVYYHNYLLGEVFASQMINYMSKNLSVENLFVDNKEMGKYMIERVFKPGESMRWNKLVEYATGESLTPKYFAEQFAR